MVVAAKRTRKRTRMVVGIFGGERERVVGGTQMLAFGSSTHSGSGN